MFFSHGPNVPLLQEKTLHVFVVSPHRLVPLALAAAGRKIGSFAVTGSSVSAEEAVSRLQTFTPDVVVFDPELIPPGRMNTCLREFGYCVPNGPSLVILLEPAQPGAAFAGRVAWSGGVRSAMTSQDLPEFWPAAITAAANGATYASPLASELFGLTAWDRLDSAIHVPFTQQAPHPVRLKARRGRLPAWA